MHSLLEDAHALYREVVRSVQAGQLFRELDLEETLGQPAATFRQVVVVGAGKASMAMAGALEARLDGRVDEGVVAVPHGYPATLPSAEQAPARVAVVEAGHPVPDAESAAAATQALALAEACHAADLLLVLISGGGSALWTAPADGLTLADVQATTGLLLHSGADIHAINTVRRHLSRIKGGRLAAAAYPATLRTLIVSDVVGDDLAGIASGPTVPDPSFFADALAVLQDFGLWDEVPASVRRHLERGVQGLVPETPKPDDPCFARSQTLLLGSNHKALEAARAEAVARGYAARIVERGVEGEAREVGRAVARQAMEVEADGPVCLLWGGETTVTVAGHGRGGRNQEVALAAALALDGCARRIVVLSGGTDGIDGPTDAAGAWVTPQTARMARARGLDPAAFLADNDAYTFFDKTAGLLRPGPTHTNVMDVLIALIAPG